MNTALKSVVGFVARRRASSSSSRNGNDVAASPLKPIDEIVTSSLLNACIVMCKKRDLVSPRIEECKDTDKVVNSILGGLASMAYLDLLDDPNCIWNAVFIVLKKFKPLLHISPADDVKSAVLRLPQHHLRIFSGLLTTSELLLHIDSYCTHEVINTLSAALIYVSVSDAGEEDTSLTATSLLEKVIEVHASLLPTHRSEFLHTAQLTHLTNSLAADETEFWKNATQYRHIIVHSNSLNLEGCRPSPRKQIITQENLLNMVPTLALPSPPKVYPIASPNVSYDMTRNPISSPRLPPAPPSPTPALSLSDVLAARVEQLLRKSSSDSPRVHSVDTDDKVDSPPPSSRPVTIYRTTSISADDISSKVDILLQHKRKKSL